MIYYYNQQYERSRISHVRLFVRLSVCIYVCTWSVWDISLKFSTLAFLTKKLLSCRNRRYRSTITYSCYINWTIKIQSVYGKFFSLTRYLHEIWLKLFFKTTVRSPKIANRPITYSCHTNWSIKIKSLYRKSFYLTWYLREIRQFIVQGKANVSEHKAQIGPL